MCVAGEVVLVDMEDNSSVHRLNVSAEVTSLSWAAHMPEEPTKVDTVFQVRRRRKMRAASWGMLLSSDSLFMFYANFGPWVGNVS